MSMHETGPCYMLNQAMFKHRYVGGQRLACCAAAVVCLLVFVPGCSRKISSQEYLERGILLAQREYFHEALVNFNLSLELQPGNADTYYERAIVYERIDKDDSALEDYTTALRFAPEFRLAFNNRGLLLHRLGQYDAAIRDFTKIIQLEADNIAAYEARGHAYAAQNEAHKAIADYTQAILLESASLGFNLEERRLAFNEIGDSGETSDDQEAPLDAIEPTGSTYNALLLAHRAQQYLKLRDYEEALLDFDLALQQDEANAKAWLGRGIALAQIGEFEDAILDLDEAAQLDIGIISDEILPILQDIAAKQTQEVNDPADVTVVSELDLDAALATDGWKVVSRDDDSQLHDIASVDGKSESKLFVVVSDELGSLKMSGPQYAALMRSTEPKSLLLLSSSAAGRIKFVANWNPVDIELKHVAVRIHDATEGNSTADSSVTNSRGGKFHLAGE